MYTILAIFAGLIGLFVTGVAVFTAWAYYSTRARLKQAGQQPEGETPAGEPDISPWDWFLRFTVADYAALFLFGFGAVFLITDLIGVMKDRDMFPMYHFGYLLCGILFCLMGMLFMFVRLVLVLRLTGGASASAHHPHEPDQPEQAE